MDSFFFGAPACHVKEIKKITSSLNDFTKTVGNLFNKFENLNKQNVPFSQLLLHALNQRLY